MISLHKEDDHIRTLIRIKGMIRNFNMPWLLNKASCISGRRNAWKNVCLIYLFFLFLFCSTLLKAYSVACILLCSITAAENTYFWPISLWLKIMLLRISSQLSLEKHCRYFWWVHEVSPSWPERIIIRVQETAHLPLPEININTYFSLRGKWRLRGGVGGQFPAPEGPAIRVSLR